MGFGVGAPVAKKMSTDCQMAYMVWAPKQAKGAAGVGLARASVRCLAASMAASAEDIAGMALLWRKALLFWLCFLPVYPEHRCNRIGSGVGTCQSTVFTFHGSPVCISAAVFCG